MRKSKQTTALALAGAVALASGAYALGSQAGNGSAEAAKGTTQTPAPYGAPGPGRGFGHPPGERPDLSTLATKLGVSEATLQKALEDLRADRPNLQDKRDQMGQDLADALGIPVAKVQAAFDKLKVGRDDRKDDFVAALAKELGLSTAKVQSALGAQRDHRGDPAALAKALGVSEQKLRQAFESLRPGHGPRGDHRGPDSAALAKALGVTQAQLNAAFDKLRAAHEADEAKLRDQFAQKLADKLNIDVAKVKDALDDFAPFGRHHP
jgi:transcriptional regulator with XRE-family HTH domain